MCRTAETPDNVNNVETNNVNTYVEVLMVCSQLWVSFVLQEGTAR